MEAIPDMAHTQRQPPSLSPFWRVQYCPTVKAYWSGEDPAENLRRADAQNNGELVQCTNLAHTGGELWSRTSHGGKIRRDKTHREATCNTGNKAGTSANANVAKLNAPSQRKHDPVRRSSHEKRTGKVDPRRPSDAACKTLRTHNTVGHQTAHEAAYGENGRHSAIHVRGEAETGGEEWVTIMRAIPACEGVDGEVELCQVITICGGVRGKEGVGEYAS